MDLGIKGKSAIITGGSRGIGRETARQFLEEGVRVTICARNAETLERTRAELAQQTGGEIQGIVADMMKTDDAERLVGAAKGGVGPGDNPVEKAGAKVSRRLPRMNQDRLKGKAQTKDLR